MQPDYLVITSCEAFENIPPGLPGHTVAFAAKLPDGLNALLPDARLLEITDSYTLIPEDQPGELARAIRQFVRDTP